MQNTHSAHLTQTSGGKIFQTLPGKNYKPRRLIGELRSDELHVDRDPEKHFMRAVQGYGFSYDLIKRTDFKILVVHLPYDTLYTTKKYLLKHGRFLNFQKNKLEKQIFLPVCEFGLERARQWEHEHNELMKAKELQTELF